MPSSLKVHMGKLKAKQAVYSYATAVLLLQHQAMPPIRRLYTYSLRPCMHAKPPDTKRN